MASESPKPHHYLRTWGYEICSEPEKFFIGKNKGAASSDRGKGDSREDAAKCLESLAFPSDYFPLRILDGLQELAEEAKKHRIDGRNPMLVLTARKMACLYQVLQQAGMDLSAYFDIVSDRFIFLSPNVNEIEKRLKNMSLKPDGQWASIYLIDDLKRRGEQLKRRARNFEVHFPSVAMTDGGPRRRALIDLQNNATDAEHFRLVSEQDGAGMIRAYSRTFARALVPYFTDFPVSPILKVNSDKFSEISKWLEKQDVYEVSSSVGIDERLRCYTLDATKLLPSDTEGARQLARLLKKCCDTVKLRFFVQSPREVTDIYKIRVMVKPVCKALPAKNVRECGFRSGLLPEKPTYHQLGQCFGYLEYLLSWYIMEHLIVFVFPKAMRDAFNGSQVDEQFARIVLGEALFERVEDDRKKLPELLCEVYPKDDQRGLPSKDGSRPPGAANRRSVVGDDLVSVVDNEISTYTRQQRNNIQGNPSIVGAKQSCKTDNDAIDGDWARLSFEDLLCRIQFREDVHDRSFVLGLALDTLTDWGKLVPDQQAIHRGDDRKVKSRLKKFEGEDDVWIERCFRAGEITAKITNRTLTGGHVSVSQTSFKRVSHGSRSVTGTSNQNADGEHQLSEDAIETRKWDLLKKSEDDAERQKCRDENPAREDVVDVQNPGEILRELLAIVDKLPGWISRAGQNVGRKKVVQELDEKIGALRNKYLRLPCPVVVDERCPERIEYAGELLRYYNAISEDACRKMQAGVSEGERKNANEYIADRVREQLREWTATHDALEEEGRPWSFGALRRLKRAVLALDTLLALAQPLFAGADDGNAVANGKEKRPSTRLISEADLFNEDELPSGLSNDVWDDWVKKLSGPPVPLLFSRKGRLFSNCSWNALAVAYRDLLGDLWHALVHASMALMLEMESSKPFESHRSRLYGSISTLDEAITTRIESRIGKQGSADKELEKLLDTVSEVTYSPFTSRDALYTAQHVVQRQWEFRSGGRWARLGHSELRHLVDSGRLIEVIDWQGVRRYPSFQFVPFCLREGLRVSRQGGLISGPDRRQSDGVEFTDRDFPFLRRDVSWTMMGSSQAVSGWNAALWFHSMLSGVGEDPGAVGDYFPSEAGYRGFLLREALSQKGLWIEDWLGDGEALLQNARVKPEFLMAHAHAVDANTRALYRLTEAGYLHPNFWASAETFESRLADLANYHEQTLTERRVNGEREFPPGRFDPSGCPKYRGEGDFYGALYLSETVTGCVLEVYDRMIAITLDDVASKKVYRYDVAKNVNGRVMYVDLKEWPALVSATPIRSITQAIANVLCYGGGSSDGSTLPKVVRYPLRTSLNQRGWVLFDKTHLNPDASPRTATEFGAREGTANHDVGNGVDKQAEERGHDPWLDPSFPGSTCWSGKFTGEFWMAVDSLREGPRDSVVCFRRFPTRALDEKDIGGPIF